MAIRTARSYTWMPIVMFACLGLAIMWRAFTSNGQLFLLDMPWPTSFQLNDYIRVFDANGQSSFAINSGTFWNVLFGILGLLIPPQIIQKLLLLCILTGAGLGMWHLASYVYSRAEMVASRTSLAYLSGLIYVCNPYVMDRLWAGHWRVLAGYALLPYIVLYAVKLFSQPKNNTTALYKFALLYALLPTLSLHWWFIVSIIGLPIVLYLVWKNRSSKRRKLVIILTRITTIWWVINIWWVASAAIIRSPIANLEPSDAILFGAISTMPGGMITTVLSGGGFWFHPFYFFAGADILWLEIVSLLLVLSAVAVLRVWLWQKILAVYCIGIFVCAAAMSVLSGYSAGSQLLANVMQLVPGTVGMREMTKLVGLLIFCYALAAPFGIAWLASKYRLQTWVRSVLVLIVISIMLAMHTAFIGNNLQPYAYPASWNRADQFLTDAKAQKVLALPFSGYMELPFAGSTLMANPTRAVFSVPVITGSSTGNPLYDDKRTVKTNQVSSAVDSMYDGTSNTEMMRAIGIDYVIVLKNIKNVPTSDMFNKSGFRMVFDNRDCSIFRVE